jgi:probable rRNA maturation factor
MPEEIISGDGALPVDIDISVEAGNWADEASLTRLVERAVTAAFAETGVAGSSELSVVFSDDSHIQ